MLRSLLALSLLSCRTMITEAESGFLLRAVEIRGTRYPYSVYVPRDFRGSREWPVILFLHGSGERGSDGLRSTQIGPGAAIRHDPERVPAIVVFPQAPLGSRWIGEPAAAAMAALERSIVEFRGDRSRTYLTGLSMGGYGTLHLALVHPGRFAALAVVCGGLLPHASTTAVQRSPLLADAAEPYVAAARALRDTPIWLFHGQTDPVIPVEESRLLYEELKRAGAADAHYTEFPGVGHNAWDKAYGDSALWQWLLAHRRAAGCPSPSK